MAIYAFELTKFLALKMASATRQMMPTAQSGGAGERLGLVAAAILIEDSLQDQNFNSFWADQAELSATETESADDPFPILDSDPDFQFEEHLSSNETGTDEPAADAWSPNPDQADERSAWIMDDSSLAAMAHAEQTVSDYYQPTTIETDWL